MSGLPPKADLRSAGETAAHRPVTGIYMSNRETTEIAAWTRTRAQVLAIEREALEAAAKQSAGSDVVPTEHELPRRMLLSLVGGHRPI
jgi:hypothetical protein